MTVLTNDAAKVRVTIPPGRTMTAQEIAHAITLDLDRVWDALWHLWISREVELRTNGRYTEWMRRTDDRS